MTLHFHLFFRVRAPRTVLRERRVGRMASAGAWSSATHGTASTFRQRWVHHQDLIFEILVKVIKLIIQIVLQFVFVLVIDIKTFSPENLLSAQKNYSFFKNATTPEPLPSHIMHPKSETLSPHISFNQQGPPISYQMLPPSIISSALKMPL